MLNNIRIIISKLVPLNLFSDFYEFWPALHIVYVIGR